MKAWLKGGLIGLVIGAIAGAWFFFYANTGPHRIVDILLGLIPTMILFAILPFIAGIFIVWLINKRINIWVKGGLIASLVFLVIAIINYTFGMCAPQGFVVITPILYPPLWMEIFENTGCESFTLIIYSTIIWFVLGTIISLIVTKIKSRNQISNG